MCLSISECVYVTVNVFVPKDLVAHCSNMALLFRKASNRSEKVSIYLLFKIPSPIEKNTHHVNLIN